MLKYIAIAAAAWIVWAFARRFWFAGSSGRNAESATILYAKIRRRRPDLPDNHARYLAIWLDSKSVRDRIPVERLLSMLTDTAGEPWESLCTRYAITYMENCGGLDITGMAPDVASFHYSEVRRGIESGFRAEEQGTPRGDDLLSVLDSSSSLREILAPCPPA